MITTNFKPLLASPAETIEYPVYASVKIDGIRGCVLGGIGLVSRKIKPIPNDHIRNLINGRNELLFHDGEIVTYTNGELDDFNTIQSKVMTASGTPDFTYFVFDHFQHINYTYEKRRHLIVPSRPDWPYKVVTQIAVTNQKDLDDLETRALEDGWEGLMVRSITGLYKYGRSTAKEGILLKVVRRQRSEGVIVGVKERMHNANEATIDALGYMKRSSHKDNKIGRGDLGALTLAWDGKVDGELFRGVTLPESGRIEFEVGTGFDDDMRSHLWQRGELLQGKMVTFEFRGVGTNSRPRFPCFIGIRED